MGVLKLTIGIIIQARTGSTRLPGKVLMPIGHLPLLGHVLGRLLLSERSFTAVVATTGLAQDDAIETFCKGSDVLCFRGSELDVLDRYYQCAQQYGFRHIIRLTADNPFTDIEELDRLVDLHLREGNQFTHSFGELPIGVGAEIFTFAALEKSWEQGHAPHHREHVDEFMLEHPESFKTGVLDIPESKKHPQLRLTVDNEEDWHLADALARNVKDEWLTTQRIISLCSESA